MVEKIYTTREAARLLSYSERQIRQKCKDLKIGYKIDGGRKWLIPEAEIKRFQELGERQIIELRSAISQHFDELSVTALKLAEVLSCYHGHHRFTIEPFISSDFPYTAHVLEVPTLNERELSNLMAHLKDEIPELIAIGEYPKACKQWFALGDKKWEEETPSVMITEDLVLKLRLRGNQGNLSGKCPDCPR